MDKVFVRSRGSLKLPSSNKFRTFVKSKSSPTCDDSKLDEWPEYFPFSGGTGIDKNGELDPYYYSYEPRVAMVDSHIDLPPESPSLRKNMKRILVKGSRYEVSDIPPPQSEPTTKKTGLYGIPSFLRPPKAKLADEAVQQPATSETIMAILGNLDTSTWSLPACMNAIRTAARRSIVLGPVDSIIDRVQGFGIPFAEEVIVSVELFVMMVVLDRLAVVVCLVCAPARIVANFLFHFL